MKEEGLKVSKGMGKKYIREEGHQGQPTIRLYNDLEVLECSRMFYHDFIFF
jgi:hypothetical protein